MPRAVGSSPSPADYFDPKSSLQYLKKLNHNLAQAEATPVAASGDQTNVKVGKHTYQQWITTAQKALEQFRKAKELPSEAQKELDLLAEQLIAIKYRSQVSCDATSDTSTLYDNLLEVLTSYRSEAKIFKNNHREYSAAQKGQIREVCERFPLFAQLLLERNAKIGRLDQIAADPKKKTHPVDDLTVRFIKWALRAGTGRHERANSVDVFVNHPMRTRDIMKIALDKRLGTIVPEDGIKIVTRNGVKVLALQIEGVYHSIMQGREDDHIQLHNHFNPSARPVEVSIQEIFDGFSEKTYGYGEFDVFADGVRLWNAIELGSWNPDLNDGAGGYDRINPEDPNCLESLPVYKEIDRDEFARLYPGQTLPKPGEWGFALRASRNYESLNISETHGFFTIYQPLANGKFRVYSLSMQSTTFPATLKSKLGILAATLDAGMHYPDESEVTSQREHAMKLYCVSDAKMREQFMPRFQKILRKALALTLYFQAQGKNCAYNAHGFFDELFSSILYGPIKELSKEYLSYTPTELKEIFTSAFKNFDEGELDKLLDDLLQKLIAKGNYPDIARLMNASIELLAQTLFKDNPDAIADIRSKMTEISDISSKAQNADELKFAMKALIKEAIHSIQHYRVYLFDADFDSGLEYIIGFIRSIPWKWLRDFVGTVILFLFFLSWRVKTIMKKREVDGLGVVFEKAISLWNSPLEKRHEFYLPASMWVWMNKQDNWRKTIPLRLDEAKKQLDIATGSTLKGRVHSPPTVLKSLPLRPQQMHSSHPVRAS